MLEKIKSKKPQTPGELLRLADRVAEQEEAHCWNPSNKRPASSVPPPSESQEDRREKRRKRKKSRRGDEAHVLATGARATPPKKDKEVATRNTTGGSNPQTEKWCSVHNTSRHDLTECNSVKGLAERVKRYEQERREGRRGGNKKDSAAPSGNRREEPKGKAPADHDDDDIGYQEANRTVAMIGGGSFACTSRRQFKTMRRELLAAVPSPEAGRRLKWSEVPITFDQRDHPDTVSTNGDLALVTSPTICNARVGRVLIDGGAALNLLSPKAFQAIKAPDMQLEPSRPIIGLTPGKVWPIGHISLPVTLGGPANFRTERIDFDVVDLNLPFNAVLGRPALVKFMMTIHHAYLMLKMPGPKGPITVRGDLEAALTCAEMCASALAPGDDGANASDRRPDPSTSQVTKKRIAADGAVPLKTIQLGDDPTKTTRIGGDLSGK